MMPILMENFLIENVLNAEKYFKVPLEVQMPDNITFIFDSCIKILSRRILSHSEVITFRPNDLITVLDTSKLLEYFLKIGGIKRNIVF